MKDSFKKIGNNVRRQAGQSLRTRSSDLFDDECVPVLSLMAIVLTCLLLECLHSYCSLPNQPIPMAVLSLLTLAWLVWRVLSVRKRNAILLRGEEGERIVAQAIEDGLVSAGYSVFHDIQLKKNGKRFNIDHLVIGPNGVFAIETKNYRKPRTGQARVTYDGVKVLWSGRECRHDAAAQAAATARAAHDYLLEVTAHHFSVKPVLCAVGWYVESTNLYGNPVLLVMEKTLASVIKKVEGLGKYSDDTLQIIKYKIEHA